MASGRPHFKYKTGATWASQTVLNRNTFKDFKAKTQEGMKFNIITINKYASDAVAPMYANANIFENVEDAALAYFYDPPQSWAVIDDCGNFPCTAP